MSADDLKRAVDLLVRRVAHREAVWWVRAARGQTRAELMHAVVQRVADLAADNEGQPRRPVPRLENDLSLPDQLRVVTADLLAVDPLPDALADATAAVTAVRHEL